LYVFQFLIFTVGYARSVANSTGKFPTTKKFGQQGKNLARKEIIWPRVIFTHSFEGICALETKLSLSVGNE
jgi:hypothetical protein